MKKHFKKRHLYHFLEESYPENLQFSKKLIWPKRKILPNVKRPLRATIKYLRYLKMDKQISRGLKQKSYFINNKRDYTINNRIFSEVLKTHPRESFSNRKKENLYLNKNFRFFFLFTRGQAFSHVTTPYIIYRKVSHFYKNLQEKKKFSILYGIKNQKELKNILKKGGKYSLSLCESKIDVLWQRTGMFSNISQIQNEIKHKRIARNGEKALSPSIPCYPGDIFQFNDISKWCGAEQIGTFYGVLKKKLPRIRYKLFLKSKLFDNKKSVFLLKKIFFYKFFRLRSIKEGGKKNKKVF